MSRAEADYGDKSKASTSTSKSTSTSTSKSTSTSTPPPFSVPHFAVDVSQFRDGGVMKIVRKMGTGDDGNVPGHEDAVTIHCVGVMHSGSRDGECFRSTRKTGCESIQFTISKAKWIVPGLHQAVKSMRRNELAVFFIRSDYGYGRNGSNKFNIPPNQHLMFEVELLDFKGDDISPQEDGSVLKSVMRKGTGFLYLPIGSQLTVSLKGRWNDSLFDSRIVSFELGVGDESGVPEGIELACQRMIPGELARVIIHPNYCHGINLAKHNLPNNAILIYEVELLRYEKPPEHFELTPSEKLQQAVLAKDKGNHYFAKLRFKQALNHYENVLNYVEHEPDFMNVDANDENEGMELLELRKCLLKAARLNCAACQLKLEKWKDAYEQCDLVLKQLDSQNLKAKFRRAQASFSMENFYQAADDYRFVDEQLQIKDSAAAVGLRKSLKAIDDLRKKERNLCRNIFAAQK